MEIIFKRDTTFRKQLFTGASFAHPAKMDAQLLIWIVEKYTQLGEDILDPMAGSGTTMLACGLGRNVALVELEEKFCKMIRDNWDLVRTRPQLGFTIGQCDIRQGDARMLRGVMADAVGFSPPYSAAQSGGGIAQEGYTKSYQRDKIRGGNHDPVGKRSYMPENCGTRSDNIQLLPYGSVDLVITSPPYEGTEARDRSTDNSYREDRENTHAGGSVKIMQGYQAASSSNIGNLKSESYLEAMFLVYQQCHIVLRSGGLMILVTKNFIRDKQIVRLDTDTVKLCEQAGFTYLERHYRKLLAQSFWRTIYHQKYPEVEKITHEDVLVFTK